MELPMFIVVTCFHCTETNNGLLGCIMLVRTHGKMSLNVASLHTARPVLVLFRLAADPLELIKLHRL